MFRTAFSTVACPDWTLERVARAAAAWGFDGVELRSFGYGSTAIACDPALTASEKVRAIFSEHGVRLACLATGVRFDEPITPPVLGRIIGDSERTVRQAKSAIDLAAQVEAPFVRVFGFEFPRGERRRTAVARITERLIRALDGARNTGVRVVVENGGSFPTAHALAELIESIGDSLLGAAYSAATAWAAGEEPIEGADALGDRLWIVKLKDYAGGAPCPLGRGEVPCADLARSLAASAFDGWVVCEWDRLWLPELAPADAILPGGLQRLYEWAGDAEQRVRRVPQTA